LAQGGERAPGPVKYGFLDAHADLDSALHRLDPRAKLIALFAAIVIMASESPGRLAPFGVYYAMVMALAIASRTPPRHLALRCAAASPFIWVAALLPLLALATDPDKTAQEALLFGASVLAKAYASILLLTLLTATTAFAQLLWALQTLRAPGALNAIVTLMYRYIFILLDEWRRISNARTCRSGGRLRGSPTRFYAMQLAQVFMRAWERSERVHGAMVARGFRGTLPEPAAGRLQAADLAFLALLPACFLTVRLLWP
jgi:cobalt/nickel transport system permease protein